MAEREKYIEVLSNTVKAVKDFNEDAPIKISLQCVEDILAMLKEQEHKDRMFRALEEDWKRLKELLKEQDERIKELELEKGWDENPDMMGKW